ncbi:MAG: hypothetical protein ACRDTM_08950 [Micromonosporaceae bacterium]
MDRESSGGRRDASWLLHEWGQRAQVVAVTMWKHEMVADLGVCKSCGRLPARDLPLFGALRGGRGGMGHRPARDPQTRRHGATSARGRPRLRTPGKGSARVTVRYAVVLTRIRDRLPRDERTMPESRICRCEFPDRATALRTARSWAVSGAVLAGIERVKVLSVEPATPLWPGRAATGE